jgi:hypothetical protein
MDFPESSKRIHKALGSITDRPAGYGFLGRGDNSGEIIANINKRLLYYYTPGQPFATAPLSEAQDIRAYNKKELENTRVRLAFPKEQPNVLHIMGLDTGQGYDSVGGIMPGEQLNSKALYPDVGSLINLRGAPNDPPGTEIYINPGWYINASGNPAFMGGDTTDPLLTDAIAALSSGEHQMALILINAADGTFVLITNTAEAGTVDDKDLFDTTTIQDDMTILADRVPTGGIVHLYYGQTEITEDDFYRSADPRTIFNATGAGGSAAPNNATYITQTASAGLSAEQALSTLASGDMQVTTGTGVVSSLKANRAATTNPLVTDDAAAGYSVGSRWINLTTATEFVCKDATIGAAVWIALVSTTATQTLTNKTLTSPVINTGVSGTAIDTDGALSANSNTRLASQKATKTYADRVTTWKRTVRLATTAALPANTYNNGSAGVGATITANANGALSIDGTAVAGTDRVLIKDEGTTSHNGIYKVDGTGSAIQPFILSRAGDSDEGPEILGQIVFVYDGVDNLRLSFRCDSTFEPTVGTSSLTYSQFGATSPFIDSTAIIKGSTDATKLFRIEVDGFTTGTTRVMTPPNQDFTPAVDTLSNLTSVAVNTTIASDTDDTDDLGTSSIKWREVFAGKLNVTSTTKGSIPAPSMTAAQRDAISSPAAGMQVYVSDQKELSFYDGSDFQDGYTPIYSLFQHPFWEHTVVSGNAPTWASDVSQSGAGYWRQNAAALNDELSYSVALPAGTYHIEAMTLKASTSGIMTIKWNGSTVSTHDLYSASVIYNNRVVSSSFNVTIGGVYTFGIKAASKNASSGGYVLAVSWYQFIRTANYP